MDILQNQFKSAAGHDGTKVVVLIQPAITSTYWLKVRL